MPDARRGFTLIEVLIALVLLAVGLLALQALGVSAARSTAWAERNSRAAALATRYLEEALLDLRHARVPPQLCLTTDKEDRVSRTVSVAEPRRPAVEVTVTPRGSGSQPYTIRTWAYSPTPLPPPDGTPCP